MNEKKGSRALEYLDEKLIMSAIDETDTNEKNKDLDLGGQKSMKKTSWIKFGAIAASLILIISAVILIGSLSHGSSAVIALDVNPSLEIEINKRDKVEEIRALNDDAAKVLDNMKLDGVDIDVAVNAIIGSMVKQGYLTTDKNSILVSVDSNSKKSSAELKSKLEQQISLTLGGSEIIASFITQDYHKKTDKKNEENNNNISEAKAALINKILTAGLLDANGIPYSFERLAKLNINELKLIIESKKIKIDGIEASGTASKTSYISSEKALNIAFDESGVTSNEITSLRSEFDYDEDKRALVYEIEFIFDNKEYEYEILAESGIILEEEIKPIKTDNKEKEEITTPENTISREAALNICYKDANVSPENIKRPEIEADMEKGIYVYEIEFKANGMEYEYTINAATGEIIQNEVEPID